MTKDIFRVAFLIGVLPWVVLISAFVALNHFTSVDRTRIEVERIEFDIGDFQSSLSFDRVSFPDSELSDVAASERLTNWAQLFIESDEAFYKKTSDFRLKFLSADGEILAISERADETFFHISEENRPSNMVVNFSLPIPPENTDQIEISYVSCTATCRVVANQFTLKVSRNPDFGSYVIDRMMSV